MENKKRTAGDGEIHLPREIIHHIQSFLNGREAAQTSLLSKWWYRAWSTCPNLAFDLEFVRGREFAKKTMQRYEDEKLKIQSLNVVQRKRYVYNKDFFLLAKELLVKAMELGVDDLHISFSNTSLFVLPDEVLESKTLARLHFSGFTLNLPPMKKTFSKLKSLSLCHLTVNGYLIRDLISKCPSIERLILHEIRSCVYGDDMNGFELGKLEFLLLSSSFELEGLFLRSHESLARFSCLKELVIWGDNNDRKDVRICSRSLERISINLLHKKILIAEFDVPNLRKFKFRGSPSSHLDFKSSREWESEIHLSCYKSNVITTPSWFSSLKQLLKMLRNSRVSLFIQVDVDMDVSLKDEESGEDGLPSLVVVETLRLNGKQAVNSVFVDNLFSICRSKSIFLGYLWHNPMKKELLEVEVEMEVDYEKMVEEVMDVKALEERFGKYSSLSWKTKSSKDPTVVFYQFRWNLDHSISP